MMTRNGWKQYRERIGALFMMPTVMKGSRSAALLQTEPLKILRQGLAWTTLSETLPRDPPASHPCQNF